MIQPTPTRRFSYWDFALVFLAGLVASIIATAVAIAIGALPLSDLMNGIVPARATFFILLPAQIFGEVLALAIISARRGTGNLTTDFGLKIDIRDWYFIFLGAALLLGLGLAFSPLANLLGVDQNPQDVVQIAESAKDFATRAMVLVGVVILGPVTEELLFRGLLLRTLLQKRSANTAIAIQALVFSLFHLLDGGAIEAALIIIPELFIVGAVLGYLAVKGGSLSRPIFVHAGFNLVTALALFFVPNLPF